MANVGCLNALPLAGLYASTSCCFCRNAGRILYPLVRQQNKIYEETCSFVTLHSGGTDRDISYLLLLGYKIKPLYRVRYLLLKLSCCKSLIVCVRQVNSSTEPGFTWHLSVMKSCWKWKKKSNPVANYWDFSLTSDVHKMKYKPDSTNEIKASSNSLGFTVEVW